MSHKPLRCRKETAMSCVRSRIIRRILPTPALFLALGTVLLCSAPALAAERINPAGNTITGHNPGMEATADGDRLTNNGRIEATATGADDAVGMGYPMAFFLNGLTLTNHGSVTASASGGTALGMRGGDNATLTNSGVITAKGDSGFGMMIRNNATLTNSGVITATGTGNSAYGMWGLDNTILTNSGTVTAIAKTTAYGMMGGQNSTLANSGVITATSTSSSAYGMNGSNNAIVTNRGTVTAIAKTTAYGMTGGQNSTLTNSGVITASADSASAQGMRLQGGTAANFGLIRVSVPDPANVHELFNNSSLYTVRITDWATDLRDFTKYKVFGSRGGTLDFSGSTFILRPGTRKRGFVWGKEYAVADMVDGNVGQGTVASATAEVPWLRAQLTGTDWRDQKLSLHPNFTRKTNIGQGVSRQGVALVAHQMFSLTDALGVQQSPSPAPAHITTASGPDARPDKNGWSGFLTPYFSYVDNSDLDYNATIVGFMAGATRRFTKQFSAGAHVGFSHADVSADLADQNGDTLTGLLGLHAVYTLTPEWYVRGQLTGFLSRASNDWKSGLPVYPLYTDADVDSRGVYASLATGYDWRINESNIITPEIGLSWLWSHQDAYSLNWEDRFGNRLPGYDLNYKAEDYTALYGTAMVRWQGAFALGDSVFRPSLGLGLRQTLTDNDIKSRLTTNGSSFSTRVSEDDTTALAEAGLAWQRGNTTLGFTYTGDYGSDQRVHAGWLTVKMAF